LAVLSIFFRQQLASFPIPAVKFIPLGTVKRLGVRIHGRWSNGQLPSAANFKPFAVPLDPGPAAIRANDGVAVGWGIDAVQAVLGERDSGVPNVNFDSTGFNGAAQVDRG
jgi:hypothetical protein